MTSEVCQYFIVIKKPASPAGINLGYIGYSYGNLKSGYQSHYKKHSVFFLTSSKHISCDLDVGTVKDLSAQEASLLLALPDDGERLKWFKEKKALQNAGALTVGASVTVKEDGRLLRGIICSIGPKDSPKYPISATYFGVELQGTDQGKATNDGWLSTMRNFSSKRNCVYVPFSEVWAVGPESPLPSELEQQLESDELNPGDRVTYFVNDECRHGMVVDVLEEAGQHIVKISTDMDEFGNRGGEVRVPLDRVAKGEVPAEPQRIEVDTAPEDMAAAPHESLVVNSLVEVTVATGNLHGIIRWMGKLPDRKEIFVGLELEEDNGTSDGTFKQVRYFTCPNKRALFIKLSSCHPDSRFQSSSSNFREKIPKLEDRDDMASSSGKLDIAVPVSTEQVDELLIGRMKGIQGHCNSCYMDAALFSLFSCSPVLDPLLFKEPTPKNASVQRMLLHDIVNPLRSKGFVEGCHIMRLRQQLQKLGCSHSFTFDEKDPEEFLIVIMQQILALDPLLKLSVGGKMQESYCYQIFLDQNHSLVLPTVQQLLEHSFHTAELKLAEVPSCLILQMPRFGKKFKMFDKIIPSLELDITDLITEGPQQCILCGDLALEECTDCFKDSLFGPTGFKVFCRDCSTKVHSHPLRKSHKPARLDIPIEYRNHKNPRGLTRDKLQLFAVLCIETSHYVSFVKHGPNSSDWIFFDSMADRHGESDGYNIPEVKACPEVGTYLEMSPAELATQVPRDMKGEAKRLFCDAYMYLYQSTSMCLYR
ncbi:ubiquitin carboxyl-terminal hydrolase CYLD isoform X2 [Salarias fasciatus]|uniref:ubiquitin carboxyl-terminal hydrolase CYLD isoform X2 n=1 Tax=Salarias fasciatus TaxID=181472 RepID=UPI001176B5E0|nr:ubiquitin carboxyl-terminal hydrolase CYLD-like isoform X2 [Salarias fasciatus]